MTIANAPAAPSIQASQSAPPSQVQLHDIHLPEQVSNLPLAPGWWLLLALIIAIAIWFYKKQKHNQRVNLNKNKALAMLNANESFTAKESLSLLKWAAMQYFSRQQLAKLYGEPLQKFLMQQLPVPHQAQFIELTTVAFTEQYQADTTDTVSASTVDLDCHQGAKLWLSNALPIKKSLAVIEEKELNR